MTEQVKKEMTKKVNEFRRELDMKIDKARREFATLLYKYLHRDGIFTDAAFFDAVLAIQVGEKHTIGDAIRRFNE